MHEQETKFGERLKELFPGNSLQEIANQIRVSKSAVQFYMDGRVPKEPILNRISKLKGVTLEWLRYGTEPKYISPGNSQARNSAGESEQTKEEYLLSHIALHLELIANTVGNGKLRDFLFEQANECTRRELSSANSEELPRWERRRA
jgi:transcriptional regulator with XRE-family HTH domain